MSTVYEVKSLKEILKIKDKGFEIPDFLMLTFIGTAISSARGMLVYKLSGTVLADFYLRLVDSQEFVGHLKQQKTHSPSKKAGSPKTLVKKVTARKKVAQ